ncbi:ABC transporter ATP-binding protein [Alteromonas halophila]|uniref:ABC transporter ATP-binding protein n=1 Tax=Alteromonas halophila TaxID=516698 RepID=A0A918MXH1_9ALTE|nr:ABC transporter ATP-binding protein [Alteromonas halophila]GGW83938.1 ABC transporter ATP-binding protein [Alteromonas halophila]
MASSHSDTANIIDMQGICKHYQMTEKTFCALNDINLSINANDYVAITGPSGAGKSTLMNILGCLDTPSSGQYHLAGVPVTQMSETQLAHIRNHSVGFIFQSFNLLPRATALENVMQPLVFRFIAMKARKARAAEALRRVGLSDKMHHFPSQLSGGQRQRVAIARALVTNPEVLLGDEPTGNLDSHTTREIMQLFDEIHDSGQTIILITHETEIANHCYRVININDGQIVSNTNHMRTEKCPIAMEQVAHV